MRSFLGFFVSYSLEYAVASAADRVDRTSGSRIELEA